MAKGLTLPAASGMLPPKVVHLVHTSSRLLAPKSIDCPIDKLPAEIIHMICLYLKPTELASLRLVSRLFGSIGLQYMVPEVHLILARYSFEQLEAIAAHPIASKHVISFFFEADRLSERSRAGWRQCVVDPGNVARFDASGRLCYEASHGGFWIDKGRRDLILNHHYTENVMAHAYEEYVELLRFQRWHPDATEMAEVMRHFPRLNELRLTINDCWQSRTSRLRKLFQPALTTFFETDAMPATRLAPLGVEQMRSLLLGAYHAGLKVETLQCGLVDWRILDQERETFALMKDSVSNVKNLRLDFNAGDEETYGNPSYLPSRPQDLRERLGDFVTAASKLEHLQIGFQSNRSALPASLENIVREHHWPSLKSINLTMIGTFEDDLVSFCSRHASTLKSVHLTSVMIWKRQGEAGWYAALDRIRKVLTLDTIVLEGLLGSATEDPDFDEDPWEEDAELAWSKVARILEQWFLRALPGADMELADFLVSSHMPAGLRDILFDQVFCL